jgi:hypothetical protein
MQWQPGGVAALQIDGQGVVAGPLVVHAAAVVVPLHQAQAVGQGHFALPARVGAAQHVEDGLLVGGAGGQVRHAAMLGPRPFPVP